MGKFVLSESELNKLVKKIIKEDSDRSEHFFQYSETIDSIENAYKRGDYEDALEFFEIEVEELMNQIIHDENLTEEEVDHLLFMAEDLLELPNNNE